MRLLLILSLLVGSLIFTGCPGRGRVQETRPGVALIFCDVTSSLLEAESDQVSKLAADLLDALPPGTRYYLFPVQMEPLRLEPFEQDTVVVDASPAVEDLMKKQRRERLKKEIRDLYLLIKSAKAPPTPYGKPDNHSCILYTLDFADNYLRQFDPAKYNRDLIYISDMTEECNTTPMHQPISLAVTDISAQTKLAKETDLGLHLSPVRVSIIIPTTKETYIVGPRPSVTDLRNFWENVFLHCGFDNDSLRNEEKFYFSSGLPTRFQKLHGGQ